MQLAYSLSSTGPCPKLSISQVGSVCATTCATFARPSPASKRPARRLYVVGPSEVGVAISKKSFSSRNEGFAVLAPRCNIGSSEGGGDVDHRAMETVLRLYTAIKNRNLGELSDVIGEECRFVCNFLSVPPAFDGKKQVLEFFSSLMRFMGDKIEFVILPTSPGGMDIGVGWNLAWDKSHVPLGKGYSFYLWHRYQGRILIRDVLMFIEPITQIHPTQWKLFPFLLPILSRISSHGISKSKTTKAFVCLLAVVFMTALFIIVKHSLL